MSPSLLLSLHMRSAWSRPKTNFQHNRENDHCLTELNLRDLNWKRYISHDQYLTACGADQRSQNSTSVSVTGMLRSKSNESHGDQFHPVSIIYPYGKRFSGIVARCATTIYKWIDFQQTHNTIACLQFNHIQWFESTKVDSRSDCTVNLTRSTVNMISLLPVYFRPGLNIAFHMCRIK